MKRIFCVLMALLICIGFSACKAFEKEALHLNVLLMEGSEAYIDTDILNNAAGNSYEVMVSVVPRVQLENAAQVAIQGGAFALIAENIDDAITENLVDMAKLSGTPVILIGAPPKTKTIDSYDKLWYLGAAPLQGGEVLGNKVGKLFKNGDIIDNGDGILNYIGFASENPGTIKSTAAATAELGAFSQENAVHNECYTADIAYNLALEAINSEAVGELIICSGTRAAQGAVKATQERQLAVPIVCIGDGALLKDADLTDKLLAYTAYPASDIAKASAAYISNILRGEAVTYGTAYAMDKHKSLLFPYVCNN